MDPYIPPVNPGSPASGESENAEDAKRQERHHDKMQAFKQAIERSRVVNEQGAALVQGPSTPQSKTPASSTQRKAVVRGNLVDVQLPEGVEVSAKGLAAIKEEAPPPKPQAQAALDPSYRQALLRMQSEGIPLPPSLLELLEQAEGGKPQKAVAKTEFEESPDQVEVVAEESADPISEARHAQTRAAAFADADPHSGSASADKSKKGQTVDAAGDVPGGLTAPGPVFTPQVQVSGQMQRVPPPAPLVQELVEFATFGRNEAGFLEFRLGLVQDALGGLRIQLASYGNRRVGIKVKGTGGKAADIGDAEIAGLIDALRAKNVEVIEVTRE